MSKKCSKCNHEIKEGLSVCTNCGTKVEGIKKNSPQIKKNSGGEGIVYVIVAVVGILVMFNISSPIGGFIYLISFIGAYSKLKNIYSMSKREGVISFAKQYLKKDKIFNEGMMVIIVVAIPIVIIIGVHRWIYADTMRMVDSFMNY